MPSLSTSPASLTAHMTWAPNRFFSPQDEVSSLCAKSPATSPLRGSSLVREQSTSHSSSSLTEWDSSTSAADDHWAFHTTCRSILVQLRRREAVHYRHACENTPESSRLRAPATAADPVRRARNHSDVSPSRISPHSFRGRCCYFANQRFPWTRDSGIGPNGRLRWWTRRW